METKVLHYRHYSIVARFEENWTWAVYTQEGDYVTRQTGRGLGGCLIEAIKYIDDREQKWQDIDTLRAVCRRLRAIIEDINHGEYDLPVKLDLLGIRWEALGIDTPAE